MSAVTKPLLKAAGSVTAIGAGVLAWSLLEARSYVVRQLTAPLLDPGTKPLRILHLSDLHLTPSHAHRVKWVRSLARFRPDLVVNTGDNLAHQDAVPTALHALEPLMEFPGVFVHGSNDYFAPRLKNPFTYLSRPTEVHEEAPRLDTEALTAGLTAGGWIDLNNGRGMFALGGQRVGFVGLDDPHMGRDSMPPDTAAEDDLRIGVTHAPYTHALDALRADGAALILAGHTHGGQVRVPGYGALVTNCDLDTARASGLHGWPGPRPDAAGGDDSTWLHVSAGVGTSPFTPVRLACRPEVTMLTLMPREG